MNCALVCKLTEIKEKFLEMKDGYRFGIVDDVEEFKFTSRSIGVIIDGETIKNGQRYINLNFYYSENKVKNDLLNFREQVREFVEFLDFNEDNFFDSAAFETKVEYGNIEDETQRLSLRTAIIKKTYKITTLLTNEKHEKMSENIYLKYEEGM